MFVRLKWFLFGTLALAVGIAGGVAISAATSNAAATTPATTAAASSPFLQHGTATHENAEKAVMGDAAAKAKAAAVKAAGGGTAGAVTTDLPGTGYEVTVTKSDGSTVELHLDNSFNVMQGRGGLDH
jgi:hypothetical protein